MNVMNRRVQSTSSVVGRQQSFHSFVHSSFVLIAVDDNNVFLRQSSNGLLVAVLVVINLLFLCLLLRFMFHFENVIIFE